MKPLLEKSETPKAEDILHAYLDYTHHLGVELYDHQEEAIFELIEGKNVILNTPTGSGKSMVATAMHYKSLCQDRISYYTVPIKALANEKFLSLCKTFGADKVGMITGDASVNPSAPIICCTAEILANLALRDGENAQVHDVIMDEFHYYSDPERGSAWQIPLLTLPQARFLLMSATMGNTEFFIEELKQRTKAETVLIQSDQRPVPLDYTYSEEPLQEQIETLIEAEKFPIYLVHFGQLSAAKSAQNLLSAQLCSKEEKQKIAAQVQDSDFKSPYGKEVQKYLKSGIGVHHAGLLPKYRILVEQLAQQGLLKVVCGTDTLGVGINVPIRTVVFTQLCKFDGSVTRILPVRDFKQIAGRAGRRGFDTIGYVIAQAPEHTIENKKMEAKANANPKKKKWVKKKAPEFGFVNWSEETFRKLIESEPEKLTSQMKIRHNTILNVLSRRNEDGCKALQQLIETSHESEGKKKSLRVKSRALFMGLVRGKVLTIIPPKKRTNEVKVQLNIDLQEDFTMNQALGLYLLETLPQLDKNDPHYALNLLSLIESILEQPHAIIKAQINRAKGDLNAELKDRDCSYEERMERLQEVDYPKPGKDFIYNTFNQFRLEHPWLAEESVKPKSIAREIYENYHSFEDYVKLYKLERSEAVLLRHLSEVYKVLDQTVPPAEKNEATQECEEYFKEMLENIDSSLLDEWEKIKNPNYLEEKEERERQLLEKQRQELENRPFTQHKIFFQEQLYQKSMQLLKTLAKDDIEGFISHFANANEIDIDALNDQLDNYYHNHDFIRIDPEARNKKQLKQEQSEGYKLSLTILDPDNFNDWILSYHLNIEECDKEKAVILHFDALQSVLDL